MYPCTKLQSIWRTSDFQTKLDQKNMTDKNFEKINIKIVTSNMPLYQISVNLENFRLRDQICPRNMN